GALGRHAPPSTGKRGPCCGSVYPGNRSTRRSPGPAVNPARIVSSEGLRTGLGDPIVRPQRSLKTILDDPQRNRLAPVPFRRVRFRRAGCGSLVAVSEGSIVARPNRREALAIAQRRVDVARRLLAGGSPESIAARFGIHKSQISRDVKAVKAEWRSKYAAHHEERVAIELARLDELLRSAWASWTRSQERTVVVREKPGGETLTTTRESSAGDPRFL